jgi:Ca-activated chloride channel family protein
MLLSLILWSCAAKSVPTDVQPEPVDARTGTMVPEAAPATARPAVRLPAGQPIVRECFGGTTRSRSSVGSSSGRGYGGSGAPGSPSAKAPVAAATPAQTASAYPPPPAPAPAKSAPMAGNAPAAEGGFASQGTLGGASGGGGSVGFGKNKADKAYPAADAVAWDAGDDDEEAAQPSRRASRVLADADEDDAPMDRREAKKEAKPTEAPRGRASTKDEDARPMTRGPVAESEPAPAPDANFDWGGVTYLSNDDSMSLASAQRLLWAVQNKGPVKTSEVRPHELLNYFSFDTTPVPAGDTFSVLASAEQTDSRTLSMAFAVKGVTPERKPLDLTLVLDRSGSMEAEGRMEYLKRGLTKMTSQLERGDRVDIVLFDDENCTPLENYVVGRDDPALLTDVIGALRPRGSTDLDAGLREGYRIAKGHDEVEGRNRRMLLISDALLNTGEVNPDVVSEIGKAYESSGIRLSAIGVGRDFNDKVLDELSEKGKGAYVYLGSEAVVDRVFGAGFTSLVQTVAHDVHFSLDLPPSLAMEKFYGEESSTHKEDVQPINYYAGTTQLFVQDLKMRDARPVRSELVKLTAEWTDVDTGEARTQTFTASVGSLLDADPHNLHKGRALLAWTDLILARSLGNDPCGAPYATWDERAGELGDDAEIAWLDGLTAPLCGQTPSTPRRVATVPGVPYKVKVDADQVIAEVGMQCGSKSSSESLTAGSNVVRFEAKPGACQLVLYGNVPMYASVDVPATGGDVRCVVRGGRLSCG